MLALIILAIGKRICCNVDFAVTVLGSERNINSKRAAGNFPEFLKLHSENIQSEKGLPEMTN